MFDFSVFLIPASGNQQLVRRSGADIATDCLMGEDWRRHYRICCRFHVNPGRIVSNVDVNGRGLQNASDSNGTASLACACSNVNWPALQRNVPPCLVGIVARTKPHRFL